MKLHHRALAGLAIAALCGTAVLAAVTTAQKDAATFRLGHMNLQAYNLGIMAKMVQGRVPYDADAARAAASNLRALAAEDWRNYFAPGTSSGDIESSRAAAAIWDQPADFAAKKQVFADAAVAMEAAAVQGIDAMKAQLPALTESCGGCHRDYRTIP